MIVVIISPPFACCSPTTVLYGAGRGKADTGMTFVQILKKMRTILQSGKYTQIPQLTSSRRLSKSNNFYLVPPTTEGTKRAVLIGINYTGQSGELSGCQNDCQNIRDYLMNVCGLEEDNIVVLMDDGQHAAPTRANILAAYQEAAAVTESGDALFCHYSGEFVYCMHFILIFVHDNLLAARRNLMLMTFLFASLLRTRWTNS